MATIVLGKLPYLAVRSTDWSPSEWMRSFLLSSHTVESVNADSLLASRDVVDTNLSSDDVFLTGSSVVDVPYEQCSLSEIGTTMDDLRDREKKVV